MTPATVILLAVVAAIVGYSGGRLHTFSRRVADDFQDWRDRITAASLRPFPRDLLAEADAKLVAASMVQREAVALIEARQAALNSGGGVVVEFKRAAR